MSFVSLLALALLVLIKSCFSSNTNSAEGNKVHGNEEV